MLAGASITAQLTKLIISQIVDKDSATLGLPNEIAVGVEGANHRDICKFNDAKSQKYLLVGRAVEGMVDSVIVASAPCT